MFALSRDDIVWKLSLVTDTDLIKHKFLYRIFTRLKLLAGIVFFFSLSYSMLCNYYVMYSIFTVFSLYDAYLLFISLCNVFSLSWYVSLAWLTLVMQRQAAVILLSLRLFLAGWMSGHVPKTTWEISLYFFYILFQTKKENFELIYNLVTLYFARKFYTFKKQTGYRC